MSNQKRLDLMTSDRRHLTIIVGMDGVEPSTQTL